MFHIDQRKQTDGEGLSKSEPSSLVAICLFVVCKNFETNYFFYSFKPELRKKLCQLFQTDKIFQRLENLDFSIKPDKDHKNKQLSLLDDEIRAISHLSALKSLELNYCLSLTGTCLSHLEPLRNLTKICISGCPQVASGLCFIETLTNLAYLDISYCEIQDPWMRFVGKLKNLVHLNLMCNRIGDEGCAQITKLTRLQTLNLAMNPQVTDKSVQTFSSLPNLQNLNLSFCRFVTPGAIQKLTKSIPNLNVEFVGCDAFETKAKKPLILLAEDSEVQARIISLVFSRYDFDVEVAKNGEIAFEMFQANSDKYDLVLMDILMPIMDGISCVKKIRDFERLHKKGNQTPIIIQTAKTETLLLNETLFRQEYNCEILRKPLDKACIMIAKQLMESKDKRKQSNINFPQRGSAEGLRKLNDQSTSSDHSEVQDSSNPKKRRTC